jgi:curved DNA-binding protein CbpA
VRSGADPFAVLGVAPGADDAGIHAAYRAAVRRTHPDAGGSAAAFADVQEAYEELRDPAARRRAEGERLRRAARPGPRPGSSRTRPPADPGPARPRQRPAPDAGAARSAMDDLLAESQRIEDEARRLAGLPPREGSERSPEDPEEDSIGAILRDAGQQLRDVAEQGAREVRRRLGDL